MLKFLHCADIHLDSPLQGLERYEGAPAERIRSASRSAMENLVRLAIDEGVRFVLIAGDLFDGDWKDYSTGLFLAKQMSLLRQAGIDAYLIAGNHDAQSNITKGLAMPQNVLRLSVRKPETIVLEDCGVAIHGQGFATREVSENLAAGYPQAAGGYFNIGLLHTSLTGRAGHEPYAPCTLEQLAAKGYDYWALGHVHAREVVCERPWVVFSGNIQGRHIRECGAKGCTLVTGDGHDVRVEHRDLDVLRWAVADVDAADAASAADVVDLARASVATQLAAADGRLLAMRLNITGACRAHGELSADGEKWANEIRAAASDASDGAAWIEKIRFATTTPIDLRELMERQDPLGDLLRFMAELSPESPQLAELATELQAFADKLPAAVRQGDDALATDPAALAPMLEDVRQMLIPRLLERSGER